MFPATEARWCFYNLGKFSQAISDFESIHFHSKPVDKYEELQRAFCAIASGDAPIPKAGRTAPTRHRTPCRS